MCCVIVTCAMFYDCIVWYLVCCVNVSCAMLCGHSMRYVARSVFVAYGRVHAV